MLAKARQNAQKIMSQQEQDELKRMQASMGNFGMGSMSPAGGYHGFKYYKQMIDPSASQ